MNFLENEHLEIGTGKFNGGTPLGQNQNDVFQNVLDVPDISRPRTNIFFEGGGWKNKSIQSRKCPGRRGRRT